MAHPRVRISSHNESRRVLDLRPGNMIIIIHQHCNDHQPSFSWPWERPGGFSLTPAVSRVMLEVVKPQAQQPLAYHSRDVMGICHEKRRDLLDIPLSQGSVGHADTRLLQKFWWRNERSHGDRAGDCCQCHGWQLTPARSWSHSWLVVPAPVMFRDGEKRHQPVLSGVKHHQP